MGREELQIEPRDDSNYAKWMTQTKYALIGKDLLDIIKAGGDSEEDKTKDRNAKAFIGLCVEKHHRVEIGSSGRTTVTAQHDYATVRLAE